LRDAGALRAAQRAGAPPPRGGEDLSRRAAGSRRPEERLSRAAPPRPRLERCPPCCASSASPVPWPPGHPRRPWPRCSRRPRGAGLAVPFLIGHATDTVAAAVGGETDTGTAVRTVLLIAGAVLAAELAVTVISNVGGWFGDVMSNRMRTILSVRYYDKLLHLPQRWFAGAITGTIVARLNRSITEITNFTKMMSNSFASMLITTAAVLAISAWYAWPLALLLLIVFPVYVWLTSLTSVK